MEYNLERVHHEYLLNKDDFEDTDISFNKEQYTKFYDIVINVILFFVLNTYESQFNKMKNGDFNLEKLNNDMIDYDTTLKTLQLQLNIYWTEFNSDTKDQLILDLESLLSLNIIKHKICLFKFIKNMSISIIKSIAKIKLENISDFKEFNEKIALLANSILQINKLTGLDDEDDFDCDGCEYNNCDLDIFWK